MMSGLKHPRALVAAIVAMAGPAVACTAEETPMPSRTPVAAGPVAAGQVASVEEVYGLWSIRDGEAVCRIALSALKAGTGHQATVERCNIPSLADGSIWRPVVGGFELLGPGDRILARFRKTGIDAFESADGRLKGERAAEF
ncbi:MAG: hypothetical protein DCF28_13805 [Alphaproteobacteria bacterium]|nr:MAG: hypothetical protein DCF28_13805 [Alphaproteobacteria bacterium]PZO33860.1 MAG: hypothetical protein DCE92_12430 [Alphaproteobacteria bacterium]